MEQVRHQGLFQGLARAVIVRRFAGIQDPGFAFEMALLADAVTGSPGEFRRIRNVLRRGMLGMGIPIAMAAFTGDRLD